MAVRGRLPVARRVLGHRLHAGREQPLGHRVAEFGDRIRVGAEGAVADHVAGTRPAQIEHRSGHDVEPGRAGLRPDQRAVQPGGAQSGLPITGVQRADGGGGGMRHPVRRSQTGDAAAFLVEHQHRVGGQHGPQIGHQARELGGIGDVAAEQDDAGRRTGSQQSPLGFRKHRPG